MRGNRSERAYSLIELVVVLALVGILLSLAVHGIRLAAAREEVDGWVRGVAADLSSGQQDAITRRVNVRATFLDHTYTSKQMQFDRNTTFYWDPASRIGGGGLANFDRLKAWKDQ